MWKSFPFLPFYQFAAFLPRRIGGIRTIGGGRLSQSIQELDITQTQDLQSREEYYSPLPFLEGRCTVKKYFGHLKNNDTKSDRDRILKVSKTFFYSQLENIQPC